MKQLPEFDARYFQKFSTHPVEIKPFDPGTREVAATYIQTLRELVMDAGFPELRLEHRGSTAFGIAGKGDIEIGIYPMDENWYEMIVFLSNQFQGIGNLEAEYARFDDVAGGFDIEVILMRGYTAVLDLQLTQYLVKHPGLLTEYVEVKNKYCYSKREYQIQNDRFFRRVIAEIPETRKNVLDMT